MFISSVLFASVALLSTSASALALAHQARVLVETNDLGKPLKGGVDSSCQIPCSSLEHSLDSDTFTSLLCSGLVSIQASSCYSCLATNGFFSLSELEAAGDAFVADCAKDGFTVSKVNVFILDDDDTSSGAPSPTNGSSSANGPSPTSGSDDKKNGGERLFTDARKIALGIMALFLAGL
ncbi:hypothetical protein B0H19DRAFT_1373199 [Mycena capillaripes]|nr:hypothetical protein B0H19DRAFT_1373199 [Mycena capillaripes]